MSSTLVKNGSRQKSRGRCANGDANPVDVHVGQRVRLRRTLLGLSQEKLGDALGLTFQQVQKYERGANRIGASRLYDLARILDVPVSFFYDEMTEQAKDSSPVGIAHGANVMGQVVERDPLAKRETLELVRAYYDIADPSIRRRVYDLAKALSGLATDPHHVAA